jgi:hypothetical protein
VVELAFLDVTISIVLDERIISSIPASSSTAILLLLK